MRLGMVTIQILVTREYLEAWLMHLCHHSSAIRFKIKQQNAFLLATAKQAKVIGCFNPLPIRSSLARMWYLLKMKLNHFCNAPKSQILITQMHLILCYHCSKIVFEGDKLTQSHEGNVQVLQQQQHAPNRDVCRAAEQCSNWSLAMAQCGWKWATNYSW
mgnify:FL=1